MRIKELRIAHKLTQIELAERVGTSPQTILNWENELHEPSIANLKKLADIFNVTVDYLIGYTPKTNEREMYIREFLSELDGNAFIELIQNQLDTIINKKGH